MYLTFVQNGIFVILLYQSFTYSSITSDPESELETPKMYLGVVGLYTANEVAYIEDANKRYEVPLQNLRHMNDPPDLNTYGFTYVSKRHMDGMKNLDRLPRNGLRYRHQAALSKDSVQLVKELTKAPLAISYSNQFRGCNKESSPEAISMIHSDLSPKGAKFMQHKLQRDFSQSKDPEEQRFGRYLSKGGHDVVLYNVWRPLKRVKDNPLALCDWRSVSDRDRKDFSIKPNGLATSIQVWNYNTHQNWHFLPEQEPHEVYIFIQHNSRAQDGHGISVPHASFYLTDNDKKDPKRMSFECRVIALFPKKGKSRRLEQKFKSIFSQTIFGKKQTSV